jgi:hypothetical protein
MALGTGNPPPGLWWGLAPALVVSLFFFLLELVPVTSRTLDSFARSFNMRGKDVLRIVFAFLIGCTTYFILRRDSCRFLVFADIFVGLLLIIVAGAMIRGGRWVMLQECEAMRWLERDLERCVHARTYDEPLTDLEKAVGENSLAVINIRMRLRKQMANRFRYKERSKALLEMRKQLHGLVAEAKERADGDKIAADNCEKVDMWLIRFNNEVEQTRRDFGWDKDKPEPIPIGKRPHDPKDRTK